MDERLVALESDFRAMSDRVAINDTRIEQHGGRLDKLEDSVLKFNTAATVLMWLGTGILAITTAIATGWSALGPHGGK